MCTVPPRSLNSSLAIPSHIFSATSSDYNARLDHCWREQSCLGCLASKHRCGWCADSSTCLPLPRSSIPLLHPIVSSTICPFYDDRWELRTATLGCKVSTMTVMVCVVTVACTVIGVAFLGLLREWLRRCAPWVSSGDGWQVEIMDRGPLGSWRQEGRWRKPTNLGRWWKFWSAKHKHESVVDERRRLLADD